MRDERSRRRTSPVTTWLARQSRELGVSLDTLRTMTLPEWAAAKLARAKREI